MYTEKIVLYRSYKSRSDIKLSAESELTFWCGSDKRIGIGERERSVMNYELRITNIGFGKLSTNICPLIESEEVVRLRAADGI